jgi:hypothetical protein
MGRCIRQGDNPNCVLDRLHALTLQPASAPDAQLRYPGITIGQLTLEVRRAKRIASARAVAISTGSSRRREPATAGRTLPASPRPATRRDLQAIHPATVGIWERIGPSRLT